MMAVVDRGPDKRRETAFDAPERVSRPRRGVFICNRGGVRVQTDRRADIDQSSFIHEKCTTIERSIRFTVPRGKSIRVAGDDDCPPPISLACLFLSAPL